VDRIQPTLPVNVLPSKVKHTMRGATARIADAEGVPKDRIRRAGDRERGSMSTAYLSRLPREFISVIAGFSPASGNYHLRRAAVQPPTALNSQTWPWIARYDASIVSGRSVTDGGLDDCDLAGNSREATPGSSRLASMQHQFPPFPLWQHRF
jgi:Centromere DNA-binding protein complex CBF3 subunit, domain 2